MLLKYTHIWCIQGKFAITRYIFSLVMKTKCRYTLFMLTISFSAFFYSLYSASSLKSGFFSFLVKVANSAIISQVCVIES